MLTCGNLTFFPFFFFFFFNYLVESLGPVDEDKSPRMP